VHWSGYDTTALDIEVDPQRCRFGSRKSNFALQALVECSGRQTRAFSLGPDPRLACLENVLFQLTVGPQHFTFFLIVLLRWICPEVVKVFFTFRQSLPVVAEHINLLQASLELGQGDSSILSVSKSSKSAHSKFFLLLFPRRGAMALFHSLSCFESTSVNQPFFEKG
jgi:hypothetical protein